MGSVTPVRETAFCRNSFGMRTSTYPSSKPSILCTYRIASDLFIPHALEIACFQAFAQKPCLTPASCADAKNRGRYWAVRAESLLLQFPDLACLPVPPHSSTLLLCPERSQGERSRRAPSHPPLSHCFQCLTHSISRNPFRFICFCIPGGGYPARSYTNIARPNHASL